MRILHVVKRLDLAGGAERLVAELVRTQESHDILYFAGKSSFYDLGEKQPFIAQNIFHAIWICLCNRKRYDVFHLHLFPAIYLAALFGKKTIIHEHNTFNRRRTIPIFRIIERFVYCRAGGVIAISDATKDSLEAWLKFNPRIFVVQNFIKKFSVPSKINPTQLNRGRKIIAMVASFTQQKRQDLLILAMKFLPDYIHVTFAGEGPTREQCMKLADEVRVGHRISFLGNVRDISTVYADVDLCILLSHWEGFGLVVVEAAQFGTPTIVSDVDGLRDVCADKRFVFQGSSPFELSEKIKVCLEFSNIPDVRRAHINYSNLFMIEDYLLKIECIYKLIIDR